MEVGVLKLDEEVVVVRLDWTRITMGMIWKQIIRLIPLRYVVPGSTSKMHKCKVWLMGKRCSALMFSLALGSPDDSQIHCSSSTFYKASYANNKQRTDELVISLMDRLFRQSGDYMNSVPTSLMIYLHCWHESLLYTEGLITVCHADSWKWLRRDRYHWQFLEGDLGDDFAYTLCLKVALLPTAKQLPPQRRQPIVWFRCARLDSRCPATSCQL